MLPECAEGAFAALDLPHEDASFLGGVLRRLGRLLWLRCWLGPGSRAGPRTLSVDRAGEPGGSAGKRPMTFADLQRMKRVSDPQISSSGRVGDVFGDGCRPPENSKVSHLWVVPVAGENVGEGDAFPLRNDRQRNERQITFWKEGESDGRFCAGWAASVVYRRRTASRGCRRSSSRAGTR